MDPVRKRLVTSRLVMVLGLGLALAAQTLPWLTYHLSEFSRVSTPVGDMSIYIWQHLRGEMNEVIRNTLGHRLPAAGVLTVWALVYLFLISSPWLAAFYSKAKPLLWIARALACTVCIPFIAAPWVVRSTFESPGGGMWFFAIATLVHAIGLFLVPKCVAGEITARAD